MPIVILKNRSGETIYETDLAGVPPGWSEARMRGLAARNAVAAGVSLENVDLAGADMSGLNFPEGVLNLSGADLRKAMMAWMNAPKARFQDALFDEGLLANANFPESDFRGASLRLADASNVNFTQSDCRGALFDQTHLTRANLRRVDLRGARFPHARYDQAVLEGAKVTREDIQILAAQGARVNVAAFHVIEPEPEVAASAASVAASVVKRSTMDLAKAAAPPTARLPDAAAADLSAIAMRITPGRMGPEGVDATPNIGGSPANTPVAAASDQTASPGADGAIYRSQVDAERLEALREDYRRTVGLKRSGDLEGEILPPGSPVDAPAEVAADGAARDATGRLYLPDEGVALFQRPSGWPQIMIWPPRALTMRINEIANDAGVASVLRRVAKGEAVSDGEWVAARDSFTKDDVLKQIARAIEANIAAAATMALFLHRVDAPTIDTMRRPGFAFLYAGDFRSIDGALNPRLARDAVDPGSARRDSPEAIEAARQQFFKAAVKTVTPDSITLADGGVVKARGDGSLRTPEITPQAARMFVEEAKARGWTQIVVRGGPEFVRAVQQAAANDPDAPPVMTAPKMSALARFRQVTMDKFTSAPAGRSMDELRGAPTGDYVRLRPAIVRAAPIVAPPAAHTPPPVAPPPVAPAPGPSHDVVRSAQTPGADTMEVAHPKAPADVSAATQPDVAAITLAAAAADEARRKKAEWDEAERRADQADLVRQTQFREETEKAAQEAERFPTPSPFHP